jgi:biotin synthase
MLTPEQAQELKAAGLDYYNHNLDTSPQYYEKIISTRTYQDRLDTLQAVRDAGMNVCCGGIVGMGEEAQDRAELLHILATLPAHPQSVPINQLVRVAGTPGLRGRRRWILLISSAPSQWPASSCRAATCVCRRAAAT